MSVNIQESIRAIMSVSKHQKLLSDFARSKYDEKFPSKRITGNYNQGWHSYKGFVIISDSKIEVKYSYGYGDVEYDDSFTIDLISEIRDNKIDEIINN